MNELLEKAIEIGPAISKNIEEDESNRRISKSVLQVLREAGFLKMFLPESLGGIEADPLTTAKVVEQVARHNTAAGWSMMVFLPSLRDYVFAFVGAVGLLYALGFLMRFQVMLRWARSVKNSFKPERL